jgi:hypothetical protein
LDPSSTDPVNREVEVRIRTDKLRENRLHRLCERRGWQLRKSRRRDPQAWDYGTYMVVDPYTNTLVAGNTNDGFGWTLDDVEEFVKPQGRAT